MKYENYLSKAFIHEDWGQSVNYTIIKNLKFNKISSEVVHISATEFLVLVLSYIWTKKKSYNKKKQNYLAKCHFQVQVIYRIYNINDFKHPKSTQTTKFHINILGAISIWIIQQIVISHSIRFVFSYF